MRLPIPAAALVASFLLALQAPPGGPGTATPFRADFESDAAAAPPRDWTLSRSPGGGGHTARVDAAAASAGRQGVLLEPSGAGAANAWGHLSAEIDASPFRGRRVLFSAAVRARCAAPGDAAYLLLRVDLPGGRRAFFENMAGRPITSDEWRRYEIEGEVDPAATIVSIGIMATGGAVASLDDVLFEERGPIAAGALPPRPLSGRSLENLVAFARLYGLVRFFHPSDESAAADWKAIAVEGARFVEDAGGAAELRRRLETIFRPLAPAAEFAILEGGAAPRAEAPGSLAPPQGSERIGWVHRGVGLDAAHPVYSSRREPVAATDGGTAAAHVEDLGGGVSCRVPLRVARVDGATWPRAGAPASGGALPFARPDFVATAADRPTRYGAVIVTWTVFRHFYPYFDVAPCDWDGALERALASAATDADAVSFLATLRRCVAVARDGHGTVTHPSDPATAQPRFTWDFVVDDEAAGAEGDRASGAERKLAVTHVAPGSGLELRRGDVILSIDGVPIDEAIAREAALASAATPQFLRVRVGRQLFHGPLGGKIRLEVAGADGRRRAVEAERTIGRLGLAEPRPDNLSEIRPGVVYCDLDRTRDAAFLEALPRLAAAKGVIFDLRGYPRTFAFLSHLSDRPLESPPWRIPLVTRPNGEGMGFELSRWTVEPESPRLAGKIAFLADGRAISAAETCLGIVEHYRLAEIVGGPTAGTNGNINPIALPGGYTVTWTGMKVTKHDGSRLHGVGIRPTAPVERTLRGVAEARDEVLEKAIEIVSG